MSRVSSTVLHRNTSGRRRPLDDVCASGLPGSDTGTPTTGRLSRTLHAARGRLSRGASALALWSVLALAPLVAADSVLVLGGSQALRSEAAFPATAVASNLQAIMSGDAALAGSTVQARDTYRAATATSVFQGRSLMAWYFWPEDRAATETLLAGGWRYVVMLEDPTVASQFPQYAFEGARAINAKVRATGGQGIVAMTWSSGATPLATFGEMAYRVADGIGAWVAPAGYAWNDLPANLKDAGTRPTARGAYVTACAVYSRIYQRSAKTSSHIPAGMDQATRNAIADVVWATVQTEAGRSHYNGRYTGPTRFAPTFNQQRAVKTTDYNSSTEWGFRYRRKDATAPWGITWNETLSGYQSFPTTGFVYDICHSRFPDAADPARWRFFATFDFKDTAGSTTMVSGVDRVMFKDLKRSGDAQETDAQDIVFTTPDNGITFLPVRVACARVKTTNPEISLYATDNNHLSDTFNHAIGSMMYTLFSGRCVIGAEPPAGSVEWQQWLCRKHGYEIAWQHATLNERIPGFEVVPGSDGTSVLTAGGPAETISVRFRYPPTAPVTVTITVDNPAAATIDTPTLTFAPGDYATARTVRVSARQLATRTPITVRLATSSADPVFNALGDMWTYTVSGYPSGSGTGVQRRFYWKVFGSTIADLLASSLYAGTPTSTAILNTAFEGPTNLANADASNNYGASMRGYFRPPVSGSYTFAISGDDVAELWLSTNEDPATATKIAYTSGPTLVRQWTKAASQTSVAIALTAGQRYFIHALHKETAGGDHVAVGVIMPDGSREMPIPAHRLDPYGSIANAAPTVATVAMATPSAVTGTTTALSVLGADDAGEAALTYTWATTGTPPAAVAFSANGMNAAKSTTATFTKAGSYTFKVTIRDAGNLTVTSSVSVTVSQTLASLAASPASVSVDAGSTQAFTTSGADQFGAAMAVTPTWTVSGGGTIAATGLFTAGATAGGPWTVTASAGGRSATAAVTVRSVTPTITSLSPATGPTTGSTTVTITGTNLSGTSVVTFGGTAATAVTVLSSSQVRCVTPARTGGAVDVRLTATTGTVTASAVFTYAYPAGPGTGITREWWTAITGTSVASLTGIAAYPANPSGTQTVTTLFEAPSNWADNYGQRMHGYFLPPVSGAYTFWIASDDASELWLSTSADPAAAVKIAGVTGYTGSRVWTASASQKSSAITLSAGTQYYIRALHKEGGSGDHLAVGVDMPGGYAEKPIAANRLLPWVANTAPTVATAASVSVNPVIGRTTVLSALGADNGGEAALTYTWATTGTPPAGVTFSANGSNAAKSATATFTRAGTYGFQITIRDAGGLTATSRVSVTVNQTLASLAVSPASVSVDAGSTQAFTASGTDQFGAAMAVTPAWTVLGGGTIAATGLFTAGATAGGPWTVTASAAGRRATATVTVLPVSTLPPPVLRYALDATTGTVAVDSALPAQNGTLVNFPAAPWGAGRIGNALTFDGVNDYVETPDDAVLDGMPRLTIAFWVKPTQNDGMARGLISKRVSYASENAYGVFLYTGGKLAVDLNGMDNRFQSVAAIPVGTWTHVAIVFDGTQAQAHRVRLYLNGVLDTTAAENGTAISATASTLRLGMLQGGTTSYAGQLDEVLIYDQVLNLDQVQELASAPPSGSG